MFIHIFMQSLDTAKHKYMGNCMLHLSTLVDIFFFKAKAWKKKTCTKSVTTTQQLRHQRMRTRQLFQSASSKFYQLNCHYIHPPPTPSFWFENWCFNHSLTMMMMINLSHQNLWNFQRYASYTHISFTWQNICDKMTEENVHIREKKKPDKFCQIHLSFYH